MYTEQWPQHMMSRTRRHPLVARCKVSQTTKWLIPSPLQVGSYTTGFLLYLH